MSDLGEGVVTSNTEVGRYGGVMVTRARAQGRVLEVATDREVGDRVSELRILRLVVDTEVILCDEVVELVVIDDGAGRVHAERVLLDTVAARVGSAMRCPLVAELLA